MCIPHGAMSSKDNGYVPQQKVKKHIVRVSKEQFEKGDPDFVDERKEAYKPKKKESFFASLFE